jgi:hypothetical protein
VEFVRFGVSRELAIEETWLVGAWEEEYLH